MTVGGRLLHSAKLLASPTYRRWRHTLRSLTIDPDMLARPIAQPTKADFLICGSPRSGTTLLLAMLFQPPRVITVMEPWDAMRLPPDALFRSLRDELDLTGRLTRGRLDVGRLLASGSVSWCRDGEKPFAVTLTEGYRLGVKLPAFWRYLDLLPNTRFLICLRDPFEVVPSYRLSGGRLAEGLDYEAPFNQRMNDELLRATNDPVERRVLLYDYIHHRIIDHLDRPNVLTVRYERWFENPSAVLAQIGTFLGVALGEPRAVVRPPRARPTSSSDPATELDRAAVRRLCRTGALLGYPVRPEQPLA